MADEILVQCENVSKKFCRSLKRSLWYGLCDIASELNPRRGQRDIVENEYRSELRRREFWAVDDVSFELRRGESLGLIGRNGAGKSTLLKLLTGLIKPDRGRICMRGRIGALIELNTGFNAILTCRENVYVYGSILGFSRMEIDQKYDAIVDFAELHDFMEAPFQSLSSGMKVRLGFAVAAQMEPDILIIDEVLAVGDVQFRTKCINAVVEISKEAAVIFVSHSMPQVGRLCSDVVLMSKGQAVFQGPTSRGIERYYRECDSDTLAAVSGMDAVVVSDFRIYVDNEEVVPRDERYTIRSGGRFTLDFAHRIPPTVRCFWSHFALIDMEQRSVAQCFSRAARPVFENSGEGRVRVTIDQLPLASGVYRIFLNLVDGQREAGFGSILYHAENLLTLEVVGNDTIGHAPVHLPGEWSTVVAGRRATA